MIINLNKLSAMCISYFESYLLTFPSPYAYIEYKQLLNTLFRARLGRLVGSPDYQLYGSGNALFSCAFWTLGEGFALSKAFTT